LILHNATIITVNEAQPSAQAAAVANGRILEVGKDPTTVEPFTLSKTSIERTMLDGKWVYEA